MIWSPVSRPAGNIIYIYIYASGQLYMCKYFAYILPRFIYNAIYLDLFIILLGKDIVWVTSNRWNLLFELVSFKKVT